MHLSLVSRESCAVRWKIHKMEVSSLVLANATFVLQFKCPDFLPHCDHTALSNLIFSERAQSKLFEL